MTFIALMTLALWIAVLILQSNLKALRKRVEHLENEKKAEQYWKPKDSV